MQILLLQFPHIKNSLELQRFYPQLSSIIKSREELKKIGGFYHERDKNSALAGQVLARYALAGVILNELELLPSVAKVDITQPNHELHESVREGHDASSALETNTTQRSRPAQQLLPIEFASRTTALSKETRKGKPVSASAILQDLTFSRNELGRPSSKYKGTPSYDYNISHHGEFTVCAISRSLNTRLGLDITKLSDDPGNLPYHAFKSVFNDEVEWPWIRQVKESPFEMSKRFSLLWALKESYVKCTGQGITIDLSLIVFSIYPNQSSVTTTNTNDTTNVNYTTNNNTIACWSREDLTVSLAVNGTPINWSFHAWMLDEKHICALCIDDTAGSVPFQEIQIHQPELVEILTYLDKL